MPIFNLKVKSKMSNAARIIDEIDIYLEKSLLKTSKLTKEDLIKFIEEKWKEADDDKYNIYQAYIIIGRMINEYKWAQDFENMMRWFNIHDLHSSSEINPTYIRNYYKGECCLKCGNEEKALEFLNLCYSENPDYIFTRAQFCYEFFNKHLENPRQLNQNDEEEEDEVYHTIELDYWQKFFKEKNPEFDFTILKNDFESYSKPRKKHLNGINGFADLLSLSTFYVTSVYKDDTPYIGFLFSCSWDSEHGLGIMTHKDKIIEIDGADIAFDIYTAKKDLKQSKK